MFSSENSDSTPIPPEFWGCSHWTSLFADAGAPSSENPNRVITFKLSQLILQRYFNVSWATGLFDVGFSRSTAFLLH